MTQLLADRLLVVDDAHLLDEASAGLLHQLVSLAGVAPVLTLPSGEQPADAITRLWKDGLVARIDVEPLAPAAVAELLRVAVGGDVDPALVDEVWTRTTGLPLFVRELVTSARSDGTLAVGGGGRWAARRPLRAPARLVDLVRSRLALLPADVRAAFELVAVADAVPLDVLEQACAAGAIAELETSSLVTVEGATRLVVRAAHPFVAGAAAELVPVVARRAAWRRFADLLDADARSPLDRARVLRWRLAGGGDVGPAALRQGVHAALEIGDLDVAVDGCDALVAAEPTFAHGLLRAKVLLRAERHADAVAALDAIAPLASGDDDVVALAQTRAQALGYGQGRDAEAGAAVADAKARAGDRLPHVEAALLLYLGRPNDALPVVAGAADTWPGDAGIYGGVVEAVSLLLLGRLDDALAVCTAVDAAIDRDVLARTDPVGDRHMVDVVRLFGQLEGSDLLVAAADGAARWAAWSAGSSASPWTHWLAWAMARASLTRGRAGEAVTWFRRVEVVSSGRLPVLLADWVAGGRAYAELLGGLVAERGTAATGGDRHAFGDDGPARAMAWRLAADGRQRDAARVLGDAADRLRDRSLFLFEVALRHDQVRLGSATAAARLSELADVVDGELTAVRAAHAVALAAGDPVALGRVAERFEALGADLFAAEAAGQGSDLARAQGLRAAGALAASAERCRKRCDAAAAPSLRLTAPAPSPLTPREHEIAALAADGRASKDIASALGISRRTVDNALQRVFVKLGVGRRTDLADVLHRHDER